MKNFQFKSLTQHKDEIFPSFCNRVQKEEIYCKFKCDHNHCTAEYIAIRNQILTELRDNDIRQEAVKKSWDLKQLRQKGMKMESAARGSSETAGENNVYW